MAENWILPPPSGGIDDHDFRDDLRAIADNVSIPSMLDTVCLAANVRFAAIARVTDTRWITCSTVDHVGIGLTPGAELVVETTLCHEVRHSGTDIIIADVHAGPYRDHPTPALYGFRSYLAVPIHWPDGRFFGTLCAMDPDPRPLDDPRIATMVRMFARMIGDTLQMGHRLQDAQAEVAQERGIAKLQEEFMAILAHDLRNPITAVHAGLRMLRRREGDPGKLEILGLLEGAAHRMTGLVANMMDHARNRLGGGIILDRRADIPLQEALDQIVAEFRTIAHSREIVAAFDIPPSLDCDRARIAQLLSNLLGNAITHGAPDGPVHVAAGVADGIFALSVTNEGDPIPQAAIPRLFDPFHRDHDGRGQGGLGLGLYIAAEIAKAHGGGMTVISDDAQTVFTFEMPVTDGAQE